MRLIDADALLEDITNVCSATQFGKSTAKMCVKRAPTADGWIKITEDPKTLPPELETILICRFTDGYKNWYKGRLSHGIFYSEDRDGEWNEFCGATHWMKEPEPPIEG